MSKRSRSANELALTPGRCLACLLAVVACWAVEVSAASPTQTNVHGTLRAAGGGPAADGQYALTFRIYADATSTKAVWEETQLGVSVNNGSFRVRLGVKKPLSAAVLAKLAAAHLGVAVNADKELSRVPLTSVSYALHAASAATAAKLSCSGCLDGSHFGGGGIKAGAIGFTYAGSQTKGGPADKALDLQCSGCVSNKELKFDGDVHLAGFGLSAGKLTAKGDIVAGGTVAAKQFIGDGSKLTGLALPSGACAVSGQVVRGIKADGSLLCVNAMDAKSLPKDALDEVSNGQLSTEFVDVFLGKSNVAIPDNTPNGVTDVIDFPDVGVAKQITVKLQFSNSAPNKVKALLYDPNFPKLPTKITDGGVDTKASFTLYDGAQSKGDVSLVLPAPNQPVKGDLKTWVGKNPKGKWRLVVIDSAYKDNKNDGAIKSWSIGIKTLSNQKVQANGQLITAGGVDFKSQPNHGFRFEIADKAPVKCDAKRLAYVYYDSKQSVLFLCDGVDFRAIAQVSPGTSKFSAGVSCKDLLNKGASKDGVYWLNPGSSNPDNAFRVYCDQTADGGGWALVMRMKNDAGLIHKSPYWTNTALFDNDSNKAMQPGTNENAKFAAYTKLSGTHIRGCKGAKGPCIAVDMSGTKTVHKVMNESFKSKSINKSTLISMFGNDPGQPHCNRSGINTNVVYTGFRLGLAGNNENECNSSDASWGWGVWGRSDSNYGCGCGLAGWSVSKKCYQGTLWVR